MNGDDVAVLDAKVVSDDTVETNTAVIEIIIRQHDQDGILALLALDEDGVTSEELQGIHSVVGEGDDGVIIVDGIGDAVGVSFVHVSPITSLRIRTHIRELGFFFFFKMAVEVSSSWRDRVSGCQRSCRHDGRCVHLSSRRPRGHWRG